MYTYFIVLLSICLQLQYHSIFINNSINAQKYNKKIIANLDNIIDYHYNKNIIANLDDIIDYHHNKNIIGLMTHILPLFIHYDKIEFVISYNKINSLLKKGFTQNSFHNEINSLLKKGFTQNSFHNEINTYIIINLGTLAKKTNTNITIIYSKFPTIAIDYYMCLHLNSDKIDILKNKSLLLQSDPLSRINVMKFNKNDIVYQSINIKPIDQNLNYNIIPITEFFE